MRVGKVVLPLSVLFSAAVGSGASTPQPPESQGVDPAALDRAAEPCDDFYQFACGGWVSRNPVPPDRSIWGRFYEIREKTTGALRELLEKAAAEATAGTPLDQKIGDYYLSCMAEPEIERLGWSPIEPRLERIAALETPEDLAREVASLHSIGVPVFFSFGSAQDFADASSVVAVADQDGLGLPD